MLSHLVDVAEGFARAAHLGQTDKAGEPYHGHLSRVAWSFPAGSVERAVGWLHDVLEDTRVVEDDLVEAGFPPEVVGPVAVLARDLTASKLAYYESVRADPVALAVKLADVADNADPARLRLLSIDDARRLRSKYEYAVGVLLETADYEEALEWVLQREQVGKAAHAAWLAIAAPGHPEARPWEELEHGQRDAWVNSVAARERFRLAFCAGRARRDGLVVSSSLVWTTTPPIAPSEWRTQETSQSPTLETFQSPSA